MCFIEQRVGNVSSLPSWPGLAGLEAEEVVAWMPWELAFGGPGMVVNIQCGGLYYPVDRRERFGAMGIHIPY